PAGDRCAGREPGGCRPGLHERTCERPRLGFSGDRLRLPRRRRRLARRCARRGDTPARRDLVGHRLVGARVRTRRDELVRFVAPAVFLLAMTILVLLIRAGLSGGGRTGASTVPVSTAAATTSPTRTTPAALTPGKPQKRYYVIQYGD